MNFIDSLTLLFLTLSAVKVSCSEKSGQSHAHTHAERERGGKKNTLDLYWRNVTTGH